jgi:hypothetical protein
MGFELKDFLESVGPSASLIFAAWIFLTFLQQRYTAAYDRYRVLIDEYRRHDDKGPRRQNVKEQILLYKRRCEQMRKATNLGVVAAMSLITTLIAAGLNVIVDLSALKYLSAFCALLGLALVIAAASFVVVENSLIQKAIQDEPSDIPDLDDAARHGRGR